MSNQVRETIDGQRWRGRRAAAGFTLVEMLVVIVIIAILIALLIPVIGVARASVQKKAVVVEVTNLGRSLDAFRTQFQTDYPLDFTGDPKLHQQQINSFVSRLFRYRNPQTDVPRTAMGPDPTLFANLDPSEALYFWLRGFSDDPANPLFGPLDVIPEEVQRSPLFEFDKDQLLDTDQDGFLEYYPKYGNQRPYIYYGHFSYIETFAMPTLLCRVGTDSRAALPAPRPYLSSVTQAIPNPLMKSAYAEPERFQIISAGLDNDYGTTLLNQKPEDFLPYVFPKGPYPEKAHKDNITNFAEGALEDRLP